MKGTKKFLFPCFLASLLPCFIFLQAIAYSEFYEYSKKISGRNTNCALCHTHGDGPEGFEEGQIKSLNKEEMEKLMRARSAFQPGIKVKSPILNAFGNYIIYKVGKKKFLELKSHPEDLPKELGFKLDLDRDGIPDAQEYLDGTLAISKEDGDPKKLFIANLKKNIKHIVLAFLCVGLLFYGFVQWLMKIHVDAVLKEIRKE